MLGYREIKYEQLKKNAESRIYGYSVEESILGTFAEEERKDFLKQ